MEKVGRVRSELEEVDTTLQNLLDEMAIDIQSLGLNERTYFRRGIGARFKGGNRGKNPLYLKKDISTSTS
jgi:hypothetical protein